MTHTITATIETATGRTVKRHTVTTDELPARREEIRQSAPRGSICTIQVQ
jgi:hypothetical protein